MKTLEAYSDASCKWCKGEPHSLPVPNTYHCPQCCADGCGGSSSQKSDGMIYAHFEYSRKDESDA